MSPEQRDVHTKFFDNGSRGSEVRMGICTTRQPGCVIVLLFSLCREDSVLKMQLFFFPRVLIQNT